jgi:hypothetical protein
MLPSSTLTRVLLIALAAPHAALHAQRAPQRQPASIPSELAVALLTSARPYFLDTGGVPLFTVGRAPEYFPHSLIPPRPMVVVGGMWTGSGGSIIVALPAREADPMSVVERALADSGWARPQSDPQRGGFVSASSPGRVPTLCRKANEAATLSPAHSATGNSSVRIDYVGDFGAPQCTARVRTTAFVPTDVLSVPSLQTPAGAMASAPSISGGSDRVDASVRLTTSLAADEVADGYASQLATAGWTVGVGAHGAGVVARPLTYTFPSGATWRGALTVLVLSPTGRDVSLRMARGM